MFGRFSYLDKTLSARAAALHADRLNNQAFFGPMADPGSRDNEAYEKQANEISDSMVSSAAANHMFFKPSGNQIQRKQRDIMQDETGSGKAIDSAAKSFMESGFGYDFGDVKIHNDEAAHRSAAGINARAYTLGNDIVFGRDEYRPDTAGGRRLLAHELTHVVQQSGRPAGLNVQHTPAPVVQRDPVTGDQSSKHIYELKEDSMTQLKTTRTGPMGETNITYDESSSTFSASFTLVWKFAHNWDNQRREDYVLGFEKSVRDAWDDRFLLTEDGGKNRSAHVKIRFNENIVRQMSNAADEDAHYHDLLTKTSGWGMDVSNVNVRAQVKGTMVSLGENDTKNQVNKGSDMAKRANFLVHDGGENKDYTQNTSAHEFGHMIGLLDEYIPDDETQLDNDTYTRGHINDRIMNVGSLVTSDVYAPFADWLSDLTKSTWKVGKKLR